MVDALTELRNRLNAPGCKGTGRWQEIANTAPCHYFTVAKIARGAIANPGFNLVSRLCAALEATEPKKRRPAQEAA